MMDSDADIAEALDQSVLEGLRELGGDEFIAELATILLEDVPEHLGNLRDATSGQDAETVAAVAHSLKSSCAQLGAMRLSALCVRIEQAGRAEDIAEVKELLDVVMPEWDRASAALEDLRS